MSSRIVVIGAGIIGAATAYELAQSGHEIHLLEKNSGVGQEVTSRNSGVIHAGLYYPPNSLKARLSIEGARRLYDWCAKKGVGHKRVGKLVVGALGDAQILESLLKNALESGVSPDALEMLDRKGIKKYHSAIRGQVALYSKGTGIVDAHQFCHSLYSAASKGGVEFHFNCGVKKIERQGHYIVHTNRGPLEADIVINAAGLYGDDIAKMVGINRYTLYPWRGDYFKIQLPYRIDTLVYPVKKPGKEASGLGLHLTVDLSGQTLIGPDCEPATSKKDYAPRPEKLRDFFKAAQFLLEDVELEKLSYETCGIRPKLRGFHESKEHDFVISEDLPGFINLIGIESPGLTASLAIGRFVKEML